MPQGVMTTTSPRSAGSIIAKPGTTDCWLSATAKARPYVQTLRDECMLFPSMAIRDRATMHQTDRNPPTALRAATG